MLGVWVVVFANVLLLTWVAAGSAFAATLKVTSTVDEMTSGDHLCSLREAVAATNAPGTASDCGTAGGVFNTIVLGAGTYTLSIAPAGSDDNATGDLNVTGTTPLRIIGAGATTTVIDAAGLGDRVLSVGAGATVTLERLTITGGHALDGANGTGGTGHGSGGQGSLGADGGGILNLGGLTLSQVAVTSSSAGRGGAGGNGGNTGLGGGAGGAGGDGGAGGGIYSSGKLTLSHVTVTNNRAGQGGAGGIGASGFDRGGGGGNGGLGGAGGGIYTTGTLALNGVAMSNNSAGPGGAGGQGATAKAGFPNQITYGGAGGSGGAGGAGGSIDNAGPSATLTVTGSTISASASGTGGNGGPGGGGGPLNPGGFGGDGGAGGSGGADGGGVANVMGTAVVTDSTVSTNVAGSGGSGGGGGAGEGIRIGGPGPAGPGGLGSSGGGIWSDGGSLTVTNSTLYSNGAGGGGTDGAGANGGAGGSGGDGGAIAITNGASSLLNVTVDANQAGGGETGGSSGANGLGGGIYVQSATSADDMILQNTIVAASSPGANCAGSSPSAITDAGHDLSFPDTTCPGINADPKLLGLNNYGGPTDTLALAPGSAAIDQVPATGARCPATDQRGVKRPQGSACDIGAFEFATPKITITSPANDATYTLGSTVHAAYRCSEGAITSPIATCTGTVPNGQPIDTSSTGTKTFTITTTDKAGNQTTKTINYTIKARDTIIRVQTGRFPHRLIARPRRRVARQSSPREGVLESMARARREHARPSRVARAN